MADEYLWDRTGEPDREVERLEKLLSRYRLTELRGARRRPLRVIALLAMAACLVMAVSLAWFVHRAPASLWKMAGKAVAVGQTISTGKESVRIEAPLVGEVRLEPNSRLRVLRSNGENQQLALTRGTMHALIWAPPARFVVDTPSAKTIDLGCAYTLSVLDDDIGLLTVQTGWVAFQAGAVESFIPAGAACRTRPHSGPGAPWFEDASETFREALARFDTTGGRGELELVASNARRRDALTLWHLAVRTSGSDRTLVARRFAELVPGVSVRGLESGDRAEIDSAWNLLGLGETNWWRTWKHSWR